MSNISAQDVLQYLQEQDFLKPEELAKRTDTTPEQIRALEQTRCIPAASYVLAGEMTVTSSFGKYQLPVIPERYYHPSIQGWVIEALSLAQTRELSDVAKLVRVEFDKHFAEALNGERPPWPDGADYAWDYLVDGTWGICLKTIDMEHLLTKENARATIRQIMSTDSTGELSEEQRDQLVAAIRGYRQVTMPFAPHEFDESSTQQEIQPAIDKYNIKSDKLVS